MDAMLAELSAHLRDSVSQCQSRGLYQSAKWSSEQLLGMPAYTAAASPIPAPPLFNDDDLVQFASSLLSLAEFQRCAFLFRHNSNLKPHLSKRGLFIACYSMYMAGEKLKDQLMYENKSNSTTQSEESGGLSGKGGIAESASVNTSNVRNPYLNDLFLDLIPFVEEYFESASEYSNVQTNAVDGFILYIFAVIVRDVRDSKQNTFFPHSQRLQSIPSTEMLFFHSLQEYPFNWSCWLDLSDYTVATHTPLPDALRHLAAQLTETPNLATEAFLTAPVAEHRDDTTNSSHDFAASSSCRTMFVCFLLHHFSASLKPKLSVMAHQVLADVFPTSLWLSSQQALMLYHLREYETSQTIFNTIRMNDPYRLQYLDILSNILYVKEDRANLSHLAHVLIKIDKFSSETNCVIGNYYSLIRQHEKAIVYFKRALKCDVKFISAYTLMGHEYIELRNTSAAIYCYRNALSVSGADYRAWYGLGQTYEILNLYQYSLYYFKKASVLRPDDSRMYCAIGNCLYKLGAIDDAISIYKKAISISDTEMVATRELAKLYEECGLLDNAAEVYRQFVDAPSTDTINTTNMSANGGGMLMNTQRDHGNKDGILFLARYYRDRHVDNLVYFYCSRLLDLHGPEGDDARAMIRELRARNGDISTSNSLLNDSTQNVSLGLEEDVRVSSRMSMSSSDMNTSVLGDVSSDYST